MTDLFSSVPSVPKQQEGTLRYENTEQHYTDKKSASFQK
jgi:hypothetical protein